MAEQLPITLGLLWSLGCGHEPIKPNQAPAVVGTIPAQSVSVGHTVDVVVSGYFSDSDGDALSYQAESSNTGVANATVSGDTVWVVGVAKGTATVKVTASDPDGLSATQSFTVTVPNRAPEAVDSIPAVETQVGDSAATVTVTAFDPEGLSAEQRFPVSVGPDRQLSILEALFESTRGAGSTRSGNWLTDASLDTWYGINVNNQGRIVALDLGQDNLQGTIPPELGDLSSLRVLELAFNYLTGTIPPELRHLSDLDRLSLLGNDLTGIIPPELGDLSNLHFLRLHLNHLTGTIPPELGHLSNLEELNLGNNELEGSIPPPNWVTCPGCGNCLSSGTA